MKKFVAFAVAAVVACGSTVAMAQCATCNQGVQFSQQPVYSAPVQYQAAPMQYQAAPMQYEAAPMQYQAAAPMQYEAAAPMQYEVAAPMQYEAAPVASSGCCGCGGGVAYDGGMGMVQGAISYEGGMSSSSESTLTVGSVINGETVVSVGETTVVESSDSASAEEGNVISGDVEPTSDGGDVIAPPAEGEGEVTPPSPEEATEGDA